MNRQQPTRRAPRASDHLRVVYVGVALGVSVALAAGCGGRSELSLYAVTGGTAGTDATGGGSPTGGDPTTGGGPTTIGSVGSGIGGGPVTTGASGSGGPAISVSSAGPTTNGGPMTSGGPTTNGVSATGVGPTTNGGPMTSGGPTTNGVSVTGVGPTTNGSAISSGGSATNGGPGMGTLFFPFADGIGPSGGPPGDCQSAGFTTDQCSWISIAPISNTEVCTKGNVARVLNDASGMPAWSIIWGAGVGLSLGGPYDARSHNVTGISFDIDTVPPGGIRVEFPASSQQYKPRYILVTAPGHVETRFAKANVGYDLSDTAPVDTTALRGFQWHVPAMSTQPVMFYFCVRNIALLGN